MSKRKCRVCGCTDQQGCVVDGLPCHWVADDLCSACAGPDAGKRGDMSSAKIEELGIGEHPLKCGCEKCLEFVAFLRREAKGGS